MGMNIHSALPGKVLGAVLGALKDRDASLASGHVAPLFLEPQTLALVCSMQTCQGEEPSSSCYHAHTDLPMWLLF